MNKIRTTGIINKNYKIKKIMYVQIIQIILEILLIMQRYIAREINYTTLILFTILFVFVILTFLK